MYRVVVTDSDFPKDRLEAEVLGDEFEVTYAQARRADEVIAAAHGAQGLLVQWALIDATVIRSLSELRAVVRFGVGLDNIDLNAAASLGIAVSNIPDYCIDEVASHACAMIVADSRRLGAYDATVKRGEWNQRGVSPPSLPSEDPVGIAGFGRIGQALAAKLVALGHAVHVYDPFMLDTDLPVVRALNLVELAGAVNHLSLHMPAGKDTIGSCGADVLASLGPDGHLVNTSRGTLVDEHALLMRSTARDSMGVARCPLHGTTTVGCGIGARAPSQSDLYPACLLLLNEERNETATPSCGAIGRTPQGGLKAATGRPGQVAGKDNLRTRTAAFTSLRHQDVGTTIWVAGASR